MLYYVLSNLLDDNDTLAALIAIAIIVIVFCTCIIAVSIKSRKEQKKIEEELKQRKQIEEQIAKEQEENLNKPEELNTENNSTKQDDN
ncbi:MAG: hypothetical protein ACI4T8_02575 [Christensenellales bacterium]